MQYHEQAGARTYGLGIANNNVEDALGHAGPVCQLSQRKGSERRCLCRLQDDLRSLALLQQCGSVAACRTRTSNCR